MRGCSDDDDDDDDDRVVLLVTMKSATFITGEVLN